MNLSLDELPLPMCLRTETAMTDDGLLRFASLVDPVNCVDSTCRPHQESEFHPNSTSINADRVMSSFSLVPFRLWSS